MASGLIQELNRLNTDDIINNPKEKREALAVCKRLEATLDDPANQAIALAFSVSHQIILHPHCN